MRRKAATAITVCLCWDCTSTQAGMIIPKEETGFHGYDPLPKVTAGND